MKENPFLDLRQLYQEPETQTIHRQMLHWMTSTFVWVNNVLNQHPPAWPEPANRRRALMMLDEPLHVQSAPIAPPVNAFLNRRIERAALEIETEVVTHGMTLWKLYNHGFVVKTPTVTLGFDLHQGLFESFHVETETFDRILQATQILFVSHDHGDHADHYAIPRMLDLGRPVVVPPRLWETEAFYPDLIKPERHWTVENQLALGESTVMFRVFPGHQGAELLNNVYQVDLPNDLSIMHTGDQSYAEDFTVWIDRVHAQVPVDILLPNCWTTDLPRLIQGVGPRLVITGHENEMSHTVDHRESFAKTYRHLTDVATPAVVMAWGERYHYEQEC